MPALTVLRCLGCADGVLNLPHQCARDRELVPYGGRCQCPRPGCGPTTPEENGNGR